jgi:hypothetical protein
MVCAIAKLLCSSSDVEGDDMYSAIVLVTMTPCANDDSRKSTTSMQWGLALLL